MQLSSTISLAEEEFLVLGKRIPKYDSSLKVTGAAKYMIDIKLPGMLYGKILRSRYPHAKILRIDTSKAEEIPGVVAVITAKDIPKLKFGFMNDNIALKGDTVLSTRDEIAAVAAVDEETAERAVEMIDVDYQPLPAVFDPLEAMKEGSPILHQEFGSNVINLGLDFKNFEEDIFEKDEYVKVEGTYKIQFITHTALGTMGALAHYEPSGILNIWANTQSPFLYQRELAKALGIEPGRIRVIQPTIGGSFGRGMDLYPPDVIASVLSMKTHRPVKILFSREEDLANSPTRQPAVFKIKTAASKDGKLVARSVEAILDVGAYVSWGAFDARVMMATSTGQYMVPNVKFTSRHVYTNNPYSGTMRGAGNPQLNFALETQMDELSEKLGIDPVEFRIMNANRPGYVTPQGMKITTCAMEETIRLAAKEIGWRGRHRAGGSRGIGFASLFHVAGGARVYRSDGCGTIIKLDDFGTVTVITGASEIGTGSDTAIAQIVSEELSIPISRVRIINDDTSVRPWDVGIHASRMTFVGGNSALMAARIAKEKLLRIASEVLNESYENLYIKNGVIYSRRETSIRMEYDKVLRRAHFKEGGDIITASYFYDPPNQMIDERTQTGNISATYGFGTQAALAEVDEETGKVNVERIIAVHDAGRIINPLGAEGQVQGGIVMAMSWALTEQLILEEGSVINRTLADYKIPTSAEIPEIKVIFVGEPDPAGPFGAKGVGEHGCIPTAAAIANAIYDAVGIRLYELPMTPERVFNALKNKAKLS
jgi:CO/xanthine dehydrogenase Mo-binding subunit